jgi:WhiB family redox-sensing transcriptional regulator
MSLITELAKQPDWFDDAQCRGTETGIFFVEDSDREDTNNWAERLSIAKAICAPCVVKADCLEFALTNRQNSGVWGGLTAKERRRITRKGA